MLLSTYRKRDGVNDAEGKSKHRKDGGKLHVGMMEWKNRRDCVRHDTK